MLLFDISTFSYKGHKVKQQNHTAIVVKQLKKKVTFSKPVMIEFTVNY